MGWSKFEIEVELSVFDLSGNGMRGVGPGREEGSEMEERKKKGKRGINERWMEDQKWGTSSTRDEKW